MSVRVYQLAKQLGIDNKRMIQLLRERGLDVRSPSNSIPTIYADALIEEVGDKKLILENDQKEENTESLESAESAVIINPAQDNEQKDKEIDTEIKEAEPKTEGKQHHDEEIVKSDVAETFEGKAPKAETTKIKTNSGDFIDLSKNIQLYKGRKSTSTRNSGIITLKKHEKKLTAPTENAEESKTDEKRPIITKDRNYSKRVPFQSSYNLNFKKKRDDRSVKFPERSSRYGQKEVYDGERRVLPPNIKPFLKKIELQVHNVDLKPIEVRPPIIVRALAAQIDVKPFQLISKLMSMNVFASMNQELDIATAQKVAEKFGYSLVFAKEPIKVKKQQTHKKVHDLEKSDETLVERAPVVCVLGHVDHGKTTLLDTIRSTKVAAGEAGGITQHVAAYQVERNGKKITFIDTPGHAAFSKMRERGANMTDIGVLVVAADDGFMPQTDEALKFAQNAGIPVVVAINKIDAKGANVDRVKQQMQQRGITPEEWGGETLCAEISALNNTNVDTLLELILLQAEMLELKASPNASPEGIVLESKIATGQGPTASVIVQEGTLKVGDYLVCGRYYCKVKSIIDDHGKQIKSAATSSPVSVTGWSGIPEVGTNFVSAKDEKSAKELSESNELAFKREHDKLVDQNSPKISNVDQLFSAIVATKEKVLNVILRSDVHGSAEALNDFLSTIKSDKIRLNILDCGVGAIGKNDVTFANTSNAEIVAFNVKVEAGAQALAKQLGVKIIQHNIIYEIIEKVREAMAECLDPELHKNKFGGAEVRQVFNIKNSVIAGCMVTEGKIVRDKFLRVIRNGEIIFQGKFSSIRRLKEDVSEVRAGFECGIVASGFNSFAEGDIIECFEIQKIQPSL